MTDIYELFKEEIWGPEDYTDRFWYKDASDLCWSDEYEESIDPDEWEDSYSSDWVRYVTERDGFMIAVLSDGCGGNYQAIFDLTKKVEQ